MSRFRGAFGDGKIIIGMIHLPPLPDYPESPGIERLIEHALADLATLQDGGAAGVLIENEYDRPHRIRATPRTVAAMTTVSSAVTRAATGLAVGCEILLNDPKASLEVANASAASFIRTDYFVDRMMRPEYGEFAIDPDGLLEYRDSIDADHVLILADIQVKYAQMIEPRPLSDSARSARDKGADAIIVTGDASGDAPSVRQLRDASAGLPVLVGSGLDSGNARTLLAACDGAIVGTSVMREGVVDADRLGEIVTVANML